MFVATLALCNWHNTSSNANIAVKKLFYSNLLYSILMGPVSQNFEQS